MMFRMRPFWLSLAVCLAIESSGANPVPDPCAIIAGKKWVLPKEARDCMSSFPLDKSIKTNVSCIFIQLDAYHINFAIDQFPGY